MTLITRMYGSGWVTSKGRKILQMEKKKLNPIFFDFFDFFSLSAAAAITGSCIMQGAISAQKVQGPPFFL